MRSLLRYRVPLGFLLALWYLWMARPHSLRLFGWAAISVLAGCVLRSWAAGYLLKGKRVAVGGPYAYVRNPLYLGSFVMGAGFCLVLFQRPVPLTTWAFWGIFVLGFGLIYRAKALAEETECVQTLGLEYESYRRKVPAFLPVRGQVSGLGSQRFSMELYRRNREYQCVWGAAAVLVFLYLKMRYAS
jgi:protein-S-isoprenylcysteine O-methyltransferase Ste14